MFAGLKDGNIEIRATVSPLPCYLCIRQYGLKDLLWNEGNKEEAISYWHREMEKIYKLLRNENEKNNHIKKRDELEKELFIKAQKAYTKEERLKIMKEAWKNLSL